MRAEEELTEWPFCLLFLSLFLSVFQSAGWHTPRRLALLANTSANLLLQRYYTPQKDLLGGQLPVGFILNQTVFLFNLRSSEVYLLRYTALPSRIQDEEEAKPVPIIARSSLAQFFRCPGPNNNNNNGGGSGSGGSSSRSSSTKVRRRRWSLF